MVYAGKLLYTLGNRKDANERAKKESKKSNRKEHPCFIVKYDGDSYRFGEKQEVN